jgi:hypothetical protein
VNLTLEAEEYILRRAARMRSPGGATDEVIVLRNILGLERKDRFGQLMSKEGPFVYVGLERIHSEFQMCNLPESGRLVYLSGFNSESDVTINVRKGGSERDTRLQIKRD